jgi:hypothetical protein
MQGWIFSLASMFAMLMYVLGFLLLSLPLPGSTGLKRYARHLIHDSFHLVLTIFILDFFVMVALSWQDIVWCSIYGTMADQCGMDGIVAFQKSTYALVMAAQQHNIDFVNSIGIGVATAVTAGQIIVALATINVWGIPLAFYYGARAGAMAATQAAYIIGPVSSIYGLALILQSFLVYYVEFIYKNWGTLAAFGILLSILPFGIGKRAGFFLVAFPVASYVMIPLHALLGPIIAENVAGFTAGMGWNIVQSYVSPQIVGLAAIPTMYFTFTAFAMSGLAALTGASSIPLQGLSTSTGGFTQSIVDQTKRGTIGSPEAKQAGMGGLSGAKRMAGLAKGEIESARKGGHVVKKDRWLEGTTSSGEKVRVGVELQRTMWSRRMMPGYFDGYNRRPLTEYDTERLREGPSLDLSRLSGTLTYPSAVRTKKGEKIDTERMIAEGRMTYKESARPHIRPRRDFRWRRDDLATKTGEEYRRRRLLSAAKRVQAAEAKELDIGHGLDAPSAPPSSLRSTLEKFRAASMPRIGDSVTAASAGTVAGLAIYDSDKDLQRAWQQHWQNKGEDLTDYQLRDVFGKDYAAWKAGTFADEQDRHFFAVHHDRIEAIERNRGEFGLGRKPLTAAVASGENVSSEGLERLRAMWVDDLNDAQRRFTGSFLMHENPSEEYGCPDTAARYDWPERRITVYDAEKNLSTDDRVHYWLSHETAHGVFDAFGHLHLTNEFEKTHPNTVFDGGYISSHPEELGITYEKVANVPQELTKMSLGDLSKEWAAHDRRAALQRLYRETWGKSYDSRYLPGEYWLDFKAPTPTENPSGVTIYKVKLSGETLTARERLGQFNRAIIHSGGLTDYSAEKLEEHRILRNDPDLSALLQDANTWPAHATNENFAECARIFTSDHPKDQLGVRGEMSEADWNKVHDAWKGVWGFMEARY